MTASTQIQWSDVAPRLASARNYWLATVDAEGAPHAVPVWGAVVNGALHLYTERRTTKAHNIARDPRVVVHLESAEEVVIVDGTLDDLGQPSEHPAVLKALDDKYPTPEDAGYLPSNEPAFDVLYRLRPARARLWELADFEGSQRRWRAEGS